MIKSLIENVIFGHKIPANMTAKTLNGSNEIMFSFPGLFGHTEIWELPIQRFGKRQRK